MQNRCHFLFAHPWRNLVLFSSVLSPRILGIFNFPFTSNRKSWKADFCGFLLCPMPEPVTWMRPLVALSFLFNNYFIYYLQKPVCSPHCSLLIRFPHTTEAQLCLEAGLFRKQESLDYTAIPAGIQSHCTPPHTAQLFGGEKPSSQCHLLSGTDWTATCSPSLPRLHLLFLQWEKEIPWVSS